MNNSTISAVTTLLAKYIKAMEIVNEAQQNVNLIKETITEAINTPCTVNTTWGSVTLVKGKRTVKITDKQLTNEIAALKEAAVKDGRAVATIGNPYLTIRLS